MRLRGLKYNSFFLPAHPRRVEAFAASWIEIAIFVWLRRCNVVEAFAASWIEIQTVYLAEYAYVEAFAASWIEIAKNGMTKFKGFSRSLCGFVD